jgi:hypothetical protein
MGRRLEVVKKSLRDEPMWVGIYMCMKATLGFSVYSYLYLKLAKTLRVYYYLLHFLFNKIREKEGGTGFAWKLGPGWGAGRWGRCPKQCIHMIHM